MSGVTAPAPRVGSVGTVRAGVQLAGSGWATVGARTLGRSEAALAMAYLNHISG
jgi:hypothetical protein